MGIFRVGPSSSIVRQHLLKREGQRSGAFTEAIRGKSAPPALEGRPSFAYFSWARKKSMSSKTGEWAKAWIEATEGGKSERT